MIKEETIRISPEEIALQQQYAKEFAALEDRPKTYFIVTYGCQMNAHDSEKLAGMLEKMGLSLAPSREEADFVLFNTCCIRDNAERKALGNVTWLKEIKKQRPHMLIGICGCMVQEPGMADTLLRRYPFVDVAFGTGNIHRLPELMLKAVEQRRRVVAVPQEQSTLIEGLPIKRESPFQSYVTVMYGCNNFCSYCIVPYVRGRERSRRKEDVIAEFKELVEKGYKDITLLGQNVNSYGKDSGFDYDFADLLSELDKIEGDYVIHFMTSHPKDATHKLIDVMSESRHIARHFHLPLQSGSDRVLKAMNRKYDFAKYISTLDYIRERMPDVTLSSDIIVGFPGETEEDFENTLDALNRARFDMVYSFQYSPRKGTPAAEMEEQISKEVKSERFDRLLKLQDSISLSSNQVLVGKTLRVLCDGPSKNNKEIFSGRTDGGKIVFFDGELDDIGQFVDINIEKGDTFALSGKIIRK